MDGSNAATVRFLFTKMGFRLDETVSLAGEDAKRWRAAFQADTYGTLYELAFAEKPACFDAAGAFLWLLSSRFATDAAAAPGLELKRERTDVLPSEESCEILFNAVPFVLGADFVTKPWIKRQYRALLAMFRLELAAYSGKAALYFEEKSQKLHVPERIFFHLVESGDPEYPFAFLATYATKTESGRVRHVPLQYALTEYDGERAKLLELLSCLNRAAEVSALVGSFVQSGELFHPLRLTAEEGYRFLQDVAALESVGILCRIPQWWKKRSCRVTLNVKLGEEKTPLLGLDSVLQMTPSLTVDGASLTQSEIEDLLRQTQGLSMIKGKWVEVDHARLRALLAQMQNYNGKMTLLQALRSQLTGSEGKIDLDGGAVLTNGKWLDKLLKTLRRPRRKSSVSVPESFSGTLRHYQETGYGWLLEMRRFGFGACLADDMGLGKTVQVLALLEQIRAESPNARVLLVVPASLLGNWQAEAARFAPQMPLQILHGAHANVLSERFAATNTFLTVTTYRMAIAIDALTEQKWDCVILDEAQAIKNPATKQTRQLKQLKSRMRIALTGTPIENDLTNLWSLFDFLNKGLLGSSEEFRRFCRGLDDEPQGYARLKNMIAPFLLRRVKTDKSIISDLPDKLEQNEYAALSRKQTVLYRKLLAETQQKLTDSEGIERQGLVLSLLLHLKQICNHPDQYLGQSEFDPKQSGKFELLGQIAATIYEKRERVLVFTQFRELTGALDDYLASIFHCRGGVIHGGVSPAQRSKIVERFQSEAYVPYLVLSVRAGGTGLNLTNANHVIHFDRWWNPAVENQATDRAFRIGQSKNVMVHKFVCKGTVEEKIDTLIESKQALAQQVIGGSAEKWITQMSNDELLSVLRLDMTEV